MQSFATHSGIVATVTGDGTVVPTIGNQGWFEYGGRLGFRITKGWVADLFVNGTAGPQPVGNTIHGGVGLRVNYLPVGIWSPNCISASASASTAAGSLVPGLSRVAMERIMSRSRLRMLCERK